MRRACPAIDSIYPDGRPGAGNQRLLSSSSSSWCFMARPIQSPLNPHPSGWTVLPSVVAGVKLRYMTAIERAAVYVRGLTGTDHPLRRRVRRPLNLLVRLLALHCRINSFEIPGESIPRGTRSSNIWAGETLSGGARP